MTTHEENVIPPMPRVPSFETADAVEIVDGKTVEAKARKPSEVRSAAALCLCLLGLMSVAAGAVTLVMFV